MRREEPRSFFLQAIFPRRQYGASRDAPVRAFTFRARTTTRRRIGSLPLPLFLSLSQTNDALLDNWLHADVTKCARKTAPWRRIFAVDDDSECVTTYVCSLFIRAILSLWLLLSFDAIMREMRFRSQENAASLVAVRRILWQSHTERVFLHTHARIRENEIESELKEQNERPRNYLNGRCKRTNVTNMRDSRN